MRLDLHEDVDLILFKAIGARGRVHLKANARKALHDTGVILVGHQRTVGVAGVRVLNHLKQRRLLTLAVDDPVGIENLVSAVLRVDLAEHHQLGVSRVAAGFGVAVAQIKDLVIAQRQPHLAVGSIQGGAPLAQQIEGASRS